MTRKPVTRDMDVTPEQYQKWLDGELVQHAFPHLSAQERDFFVLGTTEEQWKRLYGEELYAEFDRPACY